MLFIAAEIYEIKHYDFAKAKNNLIWRTSGFKDIWHGIPIEQVVEFCDRQLFKLKHVKFRMEVKKSSQSLAQ